MSELTLHIEVPDGENAEEISKKIQSRLTSLTGVVDEAFAEPEQLRTGLEIASLVAVTISIISSSAQLVNGSAQLVKASGQFAEALHNALPKIKQVLQDLGLRKVTAEVGVKRVPLDDITDADVKKVAAAGSDSRDGIDKLS